ncbi:MAG: phosphopantothenoylcysteine decarboxylase [Collinsella sp.]
MRFISNRSSGKMGIALGSRTPRRCGHARAGTDVARCSPRRECVRVQTAAEMLQAALTPFRRPMRPFARRRRDYTPAAPADHKLKRPTSAGSHRTGRDGRYFG